MDLNELLSQKLLFATEIIYMLNSLNLIESFAKLRSEKNYFSNIEILGTVVEEYLQRLEKEERTASLEFISECVIENSCELSFKNDKISGNAIGLISYIYGQLKKQLKYLTIILPKGFKFKLSKKAFDRSSRENIRKQTDLDLAFFEIGDRTESTFNYEHENLLSTLVDELKHEMG